MPAVPVGRHWVHSWGCRMTANRDRCLSVDDFNYDLPECLIAQAPLTDRHCSRLMVLDRSDGHIEHHTFIELPSLLRRGDLLVVNDTKVIPAKFFCTRPSGGRIEGLFLRQEQLGRWEVLLKGAGRCKAGETLALTGAPQVHLKLVNNRTQGNWLVEVDPPREAVEVLELAGYTPLPPYIHRPKSANNQADRMRYQTVYASMPGAVAAPTAGLHFTDSLLAAVKQAGIDVACLTLHVGLGTFLPVKTPYIAAHKMHSEWYSLPAPTADKLNATREAGGRIVAVGTTCARVLETLATSGGKFAPASGWTDIFIYPPCRFREVDALITNFHLPKSTLLMLAAAFCTPGRTDGLEMMMRAYKEAINNKYRFYSYGDAMLIR